MKDMEKAVTRISEAIENGEKILVYGDYDVDGTTAVSLLYGFLIEHYENVSYYIPDRYAEGYGVSMQGIDFAYDNGVTLMIALDCGIKAINQVDYANEKESTSSFAIITFLENLFQKHSPFWTHCNRIVSIHISRYADAVSDLSWFKHFL